MKQKLSKKVIKKIQISSLAMAAFAALISPFAYAGTAEMRMGEGDEIISYEYENSQLRMSMPEGAGYLLMNDDGLYMVNDSGGELMVFDVGQMMQGFGGMFATMTPSATTDQFVSLTGTGRNERIAGIRGEVYELRYLNDQGSERVQELVLSDDFRAIELSAMMNEMARVISSYADSDLEASKEFSTRMQSLDMGVLRYGEDMVVTSINGDRVGDERFILPADPMVMPNIADLMSGLAVPAGENAEEAEGGAASSIFSVFGNKVDRQQNRAENRTENEVDKASDKAVDKVLDKVFGGLFGR